ESGAVCAHRKCCVSDRYGVVKSDFAEVLEFLLPHHRAKRQPPEITRWEAVLGEERHPHVGGQVQVSGVRHVTVEVHGPPTGEELLGVAALEVGCHEVTHAARSASVRSGTARHPSRSERKPASMIAITVAPCSGDTG